MSDPRVLCPLKPVLFLEPVTFGTQLVNPIEHSLQAAGTFVPLVGMQA
jgi:hypothetical protein